MIIPLCLLAILGLGHCQDELPSRLQIQISINRTISEVERMIQEDPKLPRLSRAEIVDILYNITSKDLDSLKNKDKIDDARMDYKKALMVVLPYSPNSSHDNLNDLYTKPPMVQMVPDTETGTQNVEFVYNDGEMEELVYPDEPRVPSQVIDTPLNNLVASENEGETNAAENDQEDSTGSYENHRDTYSEVVDPIDFKTLSSINNRRPIYDGKPRVVYPEAPERFNLNLNNLDLTSKATTTTTTENPQEYEDSLSTDSKLEIVYSTTGTTKKPLTTKFNTVIDNEPSTEPTTYSSETTHRQVLSSDQWQYMPPPITMDIPKKIYPEYKFHAQTSSSGSPTVTTTKRPEIMTEIQEQNSEIKYEDNIENFKPMYVTPMSTNAPTLVKNKFSSSYAANGNGMREVSATMAPMRSEVKDLLASIGLSEGNPDHQPPIGSNLPISGSNDLRHTQVSGLEATRINSPSILSQNTFGTVNYDYKKGTQNLTPDMQVLLKTFGLQTSKDSEKTSTTTKRPTPIVVNLNSYSSFKPLPNTDVENQDMKDFLAKFGLGTSETDKSRGHKSIKTKKNSETSPPSLIEAVPDSMRKILENIGLISRSQKSVDDVPSTTPKLHVFKPHETPVHTEEQKEKINKLLDTVRKVQAGVANSQDVQIAAKDLLETTKTLQNGPDPLSLEEILNIYNEGIKNEVKRQEDAATTSTGNSTDTATTLATETTTTADSESTSTTMTTATMSSEATNAADLADSFGGSTRAPDPVLPMQRKTGLYFLVDWNTFLEVGEEGPEKINLRFQPKVGDRTRFIPVTVP